ncbi:carbon storage regulator CsrA [Desulfovibrio cuneatus]|uniref:carbon storage regulator CsrA n=1 Tax=Desulfovibrio cuneatus TaxID=159728 RepID=UPI000401CC88|nr:carbon storage regulator CsrA [Desulfovibrio cuneatus]
MLILTRRAGESLHIGDSIKITVLSIQGKQAKLGIIVPDDTVVYREEVYLRVKNENRQAMLASNNDLLAAAALWHTPIKK